MKYMPAILLAAILAGCDNTPKPDRTIYRLDHHCTSETTQIRAEFILSCIKNANPHSDEEPEDWLRICGNLAEETFCPEVKLEIVCGGDETNYCREISSKPFVEGV